MDNPPNVLYHVYGEHLETFFQRVDEFGGWPVKYKYVSLYHDLGYRPCEFGNDFLNTEWWSTICCADDYYMWKLSPKRKEQWRREILRKLGQELLINNAT